MGMNSVLCTTPNLAPDRASTGAATSRKSLGRKSGAASIRLSPVSSAQRTLFIGALLPCDGATLDIARKRGDVRLGGGDASQKAREHTRKGKSRQKQRTTLHQLLLL